MRKLIRRRKKLMTEKVNVMLSLENDINLHVNLLVNLIHIVYNSKQNTKKENIVQSSQEYISEGDDAYAKH